jgi:hypothetical protein
VVIFGPRLGGRPPINKRGGVAFFFLAITLVSPEKMPAKYKLQDEQFFMLTYPTTPADFDGSGIIAILERLGCSYRVGRELHADGKPHFHAMCCFDEPYSDGDARRTFTVGTRVPNIRVRRTRPERGWDYVGKHAGTKEGHFIVGEKGDRPGGDGDSAERSGNDVWHEIILARTREEFFDTASRLAPRQLACSFNSLVAYADWKYRPVAEEYATPDGEMMVPDVLAEWVDQNVRGSTGEWSLARRSGELSCSLRSRGLRATVEHSYARGRLE